MNLERTPVIKYRTSDSGDEWYGINSLKGEKGDPGDPSTMTAMFEVQENMIALMEGYSNE